MTRLRKMMLEELQRRNCSQHTTRYYIRTVEDFARRFNCPPDRLGEVVTRYSGAQAGILLQGLAQEIEKGIDEAVAQAGLTAEAICLECGPHGEGM
jgi:hypothetical protein